MIEIKIMSKSGHMPTYETEGASGMDLRALLKEDVILKPMERRLISTGLYIQLPTGYEAQIRARSGLSIKRGITLVNGIGTVDSDYRGELLIPLINLGEEKFKIKNGDRIAQMVITAYCKVKLKKVETLENTKRGTGGFGHTGSQ